MAAWGTADWRRIAAAIVVAVLPQIVAAMAARAIVDRARADAEHLRAVAVAATEDAHSAERSFVGQVHGWKNMLLRAGEPRARAAALAEFDTSELETLQALDRLVVDGRPLSIDDASIENARVEVRALVARYREAFAGLRVGDMAALTEVDMAVRGADRPLAAAIEVLVRGVDARAGAARATAYGEEIDAGTQAARLRDAAMAGTLLVLGLLYLSSARASSARLAATRLARDEALVQARESAEQASQLKSQFVANMSHEIRTPLNAIVGLSQLALGTVTSPREREYFRTIDASARSLLRIINDVLDLSKIEAGRLDLEVGPFDLDALLEDVSTVVAIAAEQKGIELLFAIDPRVAPTLVGDRTRLSQVLVNLASNGIKFTDSGEVEVSASVVTAGPDRTKLRFAVRDTGIGLDPGARSRLFRPFSQGDGSSTRRYAGTGLGLAISKELVEKMGGHLDVTSEPAAGSTFFFEIELGIAPPTPVKGGATLEALRGLRVLVVDDSRTSREILERALTALAFDVVCVESGEEAVAAAARPKAPGRAFDIVMVDWKMPQMDGLETARRIVAGSSPARRPLVLMVTAYRMEEIRSEAEEVGFDAFLAKPVSRSALVAALVEAHGKRTGLAGVSGPPARVDLAALREMRVLVAEDNAINQQVIRAILEAVGVVVEIVPDGQRALEAVRSAPSRFAAVLMDVQMPVMDGLEATRAIRAQVPGAPPILAVTAHAFEAERAACLAAGMVAHIAKPVEPDRVYDALARWAQGPRAPAPAAGGAERRQAPAGIDWPSLVARVGGERSLAESLVAQMRAEHASDVPTVRALLSRGDTAGAARIAHTLRGTAANLSAGDVARLAAELESRLASDPAGASAILEELERALQVVFGALNR
ncbi:MAG: response regulator [Polyangiaceae bacterium]